uniref:Uncharacterized protein n=1 Tax=Arundo donax TaxID=35708 RepID=A0A0A9HC88_ARUDO
MSKISKLINIHFLITTKDKCRGWTKRHCRPDLAELTNIIELLGSTCQINAPHKLAHA